MYVYMCGSSKESFPHECWFRKQFAGIYTSSVFGILVKTFPLPVIITHFYAACLKFNELYGSN